MASLQTKFLKKLAPLTVRPPRPSSAKGLTAAQFDEDLKSVFIEKADQYIALPPEKLADLPANVEPHWDRKLAGSKSLRRAFIREF